MKKFILKGLAEGLAGKSSIEAKNADMAIAMIPGLSAHKQNLNISENEISGLVACDG